LGLPVVENSQPIGVLQIVTGADFVLGIAAGRRPAPCEPSAALAAAAVAERETLFETAPIGLGADRKPQPGGAGLEVRVADRALSTVSNLSQPRAIDPEC